ncbi:MAG: hypothetical protein JO322_14895 [Candidatus Eremiobacteraeota bacterium]|nr:hypothetical protein [Candidatus Eremiobacteraeota bacterium]
MSVSSVTGRVVLATLGIAFATVLLRAQISSALVTRGDGLAYWGDRKEARASYARALFFDETNRVAADRYVFDAALSDDPADFRSGIAVASRYLVHFPLDGVLLMDRGLCEQREGSLTSAIVDFQKAGNIERDPRPLMFAALDERALHHLGRARMLLRSAIALDHRFEPARSALMRT